MFTYMSEDLHVLFVQPPLWWLTGHKSEAFERVVTMSLRKALSLMKTAEMNLTAPEVPNGTLQGCPTLWEFLSVTVIDGKPRQTSTMSLWVSDGAITLCLNERDTGLSMYAGGDTIEEALVCLEGKLNQQQPEWRKGYSGARKGKKG